MWCRPVGNNARSSTPNRNESSPPGSFPEACPKAINPLETQGQINDTRNETGIERTRAIIGTNLCPWNICKKTGIF